MTVGAEKIETTEHGDSGTDGVTDAHYLVEGEERLLSLDQIDPDFFLAPVDL